MKNTMVLALSAILLVSCNTKNKYRYEARSSGDPVVIDNKTEKDLEKRAFSPSCDEPVYSLATKSIQFKDLRIQNDISSVDADVVIAQEEYMADITVSAIQDAKDLTEPARQEFSYRYGEVAPFVMERIGVDNTKDIDYSIEFSGTEITSTFQMNLKFNELNFIDFNLKNASAEQSLKTNFVMPALKETKVAAVKLENSDVAVVVEVTEECGENTLAQAEILEQKLFAVIASNTPEEAKENATVIELLNSSDAPVAGEVVPVVNETVIVDTVIENDRSESKVEDKKHKPNDFVILDQKIEIEIERRNKEEGEILSYDPGFIQVEVWKHLNKRAYAAHINKMVKKASLIIRLDKKEKKQRARFKKSQEEALIIKNRADEKRLLELTSDLSFGMDDNTEIGIKIKEESVQVENSVLEEIQNDE